MTAGSLSEQVARFAAELRYEDLPAEVIERVRLHTLDIVGVCLLGAPMDFARILRAVAGASGGAPESTLIGSGGLKCPPPGGAATAGPRTATNSRHLPAALAREAR